MRVVLYACVCIYIHRLQLLWRNFGLDCAFGAYYSDRIHTQIHIHTHIRNLAEKLSYIHTHKYTHTYTHTHQKPSREAESVGKPSHRHQVRKRPHFQSIFVHFHTHTHIRNLAEKLSYIHTHTHTHTRNLAERLNQWENHRTDIKYENALIFKVFLFEFVNNFLAMIWIAFLSPYLCTYMDNLSEELIKNDSEGSCLAQKFDEVSGT
jgi:hypothetical protein